MRSSRLRLLSLVAISVLLVGCANNEPSDLESPNVVWPDTAPSTEFDDSPYVQAFQASIFEAAIAWNNLDYSDADLIRYGGHVHAVDLAFRGESSFVSDYYFELGLDQGADPSVYLFPGPPTIIPTNVIEQDGNAAILEFCSRYQSNAHEWEPGAGRVRITLHDDGSSTIVASAYAAGETQGHIDHCQTLDIPLAKFDPSPTPVPSPTPGSIRPPLPAKAYDFESSTD